MKEPTSEQLDEIRKCLAGGRKIEAIKIYRGATGQGLKESKKYVDSMIVRLLEKDPVKYEKVAHSGSGCMSVLVLGFGLTALFVVSQTV